LAKSSPPTLKFLLAHPAHLIALGFGSGLAPFAPGTFGTLFGWWSFNLLQARLSPVASTALWPWILIGSFIVGIRACDKTGRDLGIADHGAMVWDEIVAMWLVLLFIPNTLIAQAWAFAAFRLFDIAKPPPIRWFDRQWKGGFGVMWDDIVAAFYALLTIALYIRWVH
jgi:phosphatidylglycerophosphatase A